ncbi:TonB-dependent receptor plug domain-containing protein, partial [Oceanospirillum sp. HFRX-1_2]
MTPARTLLSLAITAALTGTPFSLAYAETGTQTSPVEASESGLVIEITRGQQQENLSQPLESVQPAPVTDGGELLKSLNGISGTRMGGRAIDPIIRGQKQTAVNVLLDGAYLHGGCPNRMD